MAKEDESRTSFVSWLALGISLIALVVSLVAVHRPTFQGAQEEIPAQIRSLQQKVEIEQTRQKLEDIRQRISSGVLNATNAQSEITQIRNNLKDRFQDAGGAAKGSWQQLDDQLNQVETSLREGGANALGIIDNTINTLKTNIRFD